MELKRVVFGVVVAVSALAVATDVHAFWGSRGSCGSSGGSWGSSGGSWGSSGGSWGSSGGSWGSRGSCGSHGGFFRRGSWGSCGSSGGSYGSCGSHGSAGSVGGSAYIIGGYGEVYAASAPASSGSRIAKSTTTRLTLHVPEDAKVSLAGVETKQNGETRQFSTTRLAPGQSWNDYKVVVEVERDGRTLSEERIITLRGGDAQELSIDLDGMQVAKL